VFCGFRLVEICIESVLRRGGGFCVGFGAWVYGTACMTRLMDEQWSESR
jgi:hypothetical protein